MQRRCQQILSVVTSGLMLLSKEIDADERNVARLRRVCCVVVVEGRGGGAEKIFSVLSSITEDRPTPSLNIFKQINITSSSSSGVMFGAPRLQPVENILFSSLMGSPYIFLGLYCCRAGG